MKNIKFTYDGKEYTLEFTRKTVKEMERNGFTLDNIDSTPVTTSEDLFKGAFRANHRYLRNDEIEAIYNNIINKNSLFKKLVELYNEPLMELVEDKEVEDKGNAVAWDANF